MKIYAGYVNKSLQDKRGYGYDIKEYKAFYKEEISCLRACVKQGWQYEEIELKDTCPEDVYNATVKGIFSKNMRFI